MRWMRCPAADSPKNSSGAPGVELRVMNEAGSDLARAVPPRGTKTSVGRWSPASTSGPNMKASVALCSEW
eukprot:scaffold31548_cov63-Phaeocystis_antarctica.AAC.4